MKLLRRKASTGQKCIIFISKRRTYFEVKAYYENKGEKWGN